MPDYRDPIVFVKPRFQNFLSARNCKADFCRFLRFEELRFRDGLVWTVGLTVEIKLRFQIFPA